MDMMKMSWSAFSPGCVWCEVFVYNGLDTIQLALPCFRWFVNTAGVRWQLRCSRPFFSFFRLLCFFLDVCQRVLGWLPFLRQSRLSTSSCLSLYIFFVLFMFLLLISFDCFVDVFKTIFLLCSFYLTSNTCYYYRQLFFLIVFVPDIQI